MFCRNCGKELTGAPEICLNCGAKPMAGTGFCPGCGAPITPLTEICMKCGVRVRGKPVGETWTDIYNSTFDLSTLSNEQRSEFRQHQFTSTFPTAVVILLHFVTVGIFTLVYFGLKHSKLPMIKHNDFKAGKAIGFMFIPFFNLYWQFRFWLRLVDRVNLQLRLRGSPPTISKDLMLATIIVGLIPFVNFAAVVMYPICIGQIQIACNKLAEIRLQ
jgi:hypothetical protein